MDPKLSFFVQNRGTAIRPARTVATRALLLAAQLPVPDQGRSFLIVEGALVGCWRACVSTVRLAGEQVSVRFDRHGQSLRVTALPTLVGWTTQLPESANTTPNLLHHISVEASNDPHCIADNRFDCSQRYLTTQWLENAPLWAELAVGRRMFRAASTIETVWRSAYYTFDDVSQSRLVQNSQALRPWRQPRGAARAICGTSC